MLIWSSLAIKELKTHKRFFGLFVTYLAIGLLSILLLSSFRDSALIYLDKELKNILTADLAVFSRAPLKKDHLEVIENNFQREAESRKVYFFSMAQGKNISRLVNVQAIDNNFPLYGKFLLQDTNVNKLTIQERLLEQSQIWLHKDTRLSLGLQQGDKLKIGQSSFIVGEDIITDPVTNFGTALIAPTVYIGLNKLQETKLLDLGSRINYVKYYKLKNENLDLRELVKKIKLVLNEKFSSNHRLRISSYINANDRVKRIVNYSSGYFGLVAAATLFIIFIGISYLFRNYFNRKLKDIAILMSLGAERKNIYSNFIYQLLFLGLTSSILSILLGKMIFWVFNTNVQAYFPQNFTLLISWQTMLFTLFLGSCASILFCIPSLVTLRYFTPALIFRESKQLKVHLPTKLPQFLSYLPIMIFFWGLVIWQVGLLAGSIFLALFIAIIFILILLGYFYFFLCQLFSHKASFSLKIILRNLYRKKFLNLITFTALALSSIIFNLVPQIQQSIANEIQQPKNYVIPNLFLFDIQPEQLDELKTVTKKLGVKLEHITPLVRARLEKINGKENIRAVDNEDRQNFSRRRGFNISYRDNLSSSEYILEGRELKKDYEEGEIVELSIEREFAAEQKLKLGDLMQFNIQGITFLAKIVNFRFVKWNSFQPNFFVMFQPGVLEDAPKTFIASIASLSNESKLMVQTEVTKIFPNISIIDITKVIKSLLNISEKIVWIISFLLVLVLFAVLGLIYIILRIEMQKRSWEISLFKSFGSSTLKVQLLNYAEFFILAVLAITSGIIISYILFIIAAKLLFDSFWFFNGLVLLLVPSFILSFLSLICYFALKGIITKKPYKLLLE